MHSLKKYTLKTCSILTALLLFQVSLSSQHQEIEHQIPTVPLKISQGDYYWIDIEELVIDGSPVDYYETFILAESNTKSIPLKQFGRFQGPNGVYNINSNINQSIPNSRIRAKITIVNKETHLLRNKYNVSATGVLKRKNISTSIFVDEVGLEWELISLIGNFYHDPCNTVKLLHKVPGGGEYETIRELKESEKNITGCGIGIGIQELRGCNILSPPYGSSYNFGHTTLTGILPGDKHKELDINPHNEWGGQYSYNGQGCKSYQSTLFLFDLSGSMNDNGGGTIPKIEQAKQASQSSLRALSTNSQGVQNQVAVYGFAGGCSPDPTREFSPFDTDLVAVEQRILQMQAGGGTPLGNAIRAAECKMAAHLQLTGQTKGKLILLSDGQGTCGAIRPAGVYNSAPLQHRAPMIIDANQCGLPAGQPLAVSYYTVGFNIPAGSPAERDLQYLSQSSRGKYLNVQNQTQLTRAFRKFNRVYRPKMNPATNTLSRDNRADFQQGVNVILDERFPTALQDWETLAKSNPDDCHVVYNLALAQEANDLYREAIENYQQYLNLCPSPDDEAFVLAQIAFLEEEFRQFVAFQRDVVLSDLAYLELHFKQIQNGQSLRLAAEFKGFLQEKGNYYALLPRLLASNDRFLKNLTEDIASALNRASAMIKRSPETWDRDATPVISMLYLNLKDLKEEM